MPATAYVRGWMPRIEANKISMSKPPRVGTGGRALEGLVQQLGFSNIGAFNWRNMTQTDMNRFMSMLQSSGMSADDPRIAQVISAAKSDGLKAAPWTSTSSTSSGSGGGGTVSPSPAPPSTAAQDEARRQWEAEQEARRQWEAQQRAIQEEANRIAAQRAAQEEAARQAQLRLQQEEVERVRRMQEEAARAEAERIRKEKEAYEQARAPRWVRSRAQRFDPTRHSLVGGETAQDTVTLPDGRQMTRQQAYQRGWNVTRTPGDFGASQDVLGQRQTFVMQVYPSQMAAVRQYVAQQGGQVTAAFNGQLQVNAPVGSLDKMWDIPGVQIFEGRGGVGTAAGYLPAGYDESNSSGSQGWQPQAGPSFSTKGTSSGPAPKQFAVDAGGGSVGSQLAANIGDPAQSAGGWGEFAPIVGAPPLVNWQTWQNMTPFEKASYRVLAESAGPWEQHMQRLRENWAQEGVTATPDQTRLTAATMAPRDVLGLNFTAETFGEKPEDFWQRQGRTWATADTGRTGISGGSRGARNRQLAIAR